MAETPLLTRRRVLTAGLVAVPTVGVSAVGLTAWSWWTDPPTGSFRYISEDEARFLDALAEAAWPTGKLPGGGAVGAPAYLDEVVDGMAEFQGHLLRLSMHALEQLPLVTHGRVFSALELDEASALLQSWMDHPQAELRGAVVSLVLFCGMAWTSHPSVAPVIEPSFWCGYGR